MEHWKVLSATMVGRRSRMVKAATFRPWWQPFNSFYFETLSFFPLFPFFLLLCKKLGRGPWTSRLPSVSPALINLDCWLVDWKNNVKNASSSWYTLKFFTGSFQNIFLFSKLNAETSAIKTLFKSLDIFSLWYGSCIQL